MADQPDRNEIGVKGKLPRLPSNPHILTEDDLPRIYWQQPAACTYEVLSDPDRQLPWSVPAGRGHDDVLICAALTARVDETDSAPGCVARS